MGTSARKTLRVVALSDTHGFHRQIEVPPGDVLIHAGDLTRHGNFSELEEINDWFGSLPHPHKIIVAGNHDFCFEQDQDRCRELLTGAIYLQDEGVEIEGIRFWGSPWQPRFLNWAFNLERGEQLREKWDQIPADTDVLITHGPPHGILDAVREGEHVGCEELRIAVERVRPRVHLFGHIHEGAGVVERDGITFGNACICNEYYAPLNPAVVVEIER